MRSNRRVLVVDDESTIRHVFENLLLEHECEVQTAASAEEGLTAVRMAPPAVALVDVVLPAMNGLDLLVEIKKISPDTEVVMMTSHASLDRTLTALRHGAYDFLQKPLEDISYLWAVVKRALEKRDLALRNVALIAEKEGRNRELSRAVARLTSLVEAGRVMSEIDSIQALLDFFIGFTADKLDVDRASIMLIDTETGRLTIEASLGLDDVDPSSIGVELGQGVAGTVAKNGQPLLVTDTGDTLQIPREPKKDLSKSFLSAPIVVSVPLQSSCKTLGVINLTNRRNGQPFGQDDLNYVLALSGHLAVTIEKVRQVEELQHAYDAIRMTQDQLVVSERMRTVGQVTAGIADEFNNLLSVILGKANLATMKLEGDPPDLTVVAAHLETITRAATQGASVIKHIHRYTHASGGEEDVDLDLNTVVREAVELNRSRWEAQAGTDGARIATELQLDETAPVRGDTAEFRQVLQVLVGNALDAMPAGGTLTVRTRRAGDDVVLDVQDTGVGMDASTKARVFEPFFSTKGEGRGLGTSILFEIVNRRAGKIAFASAPGEGTTFTVRMPARVAAPAGAAGTADAPERTPCVLLVDDEEPVRQTFEEALLDRGIEVLSACSGHQALELFDPARVDLVVTDLGMDGMSGLELARLLKAQVADLPVILISGWAGQYFSDKADDTGIDLVLAKPCPIRKFQQAVEDLLPGDQASGTGAADSSDDDTHAVAETDVDLAAVIGRMSFPD